MKKGLFAFLVILITLTLISLSGCGSKSEALPSDEPSGNTEEPVSAVTDSEGAMPSVEPTPGDDSTAEPSAAASSPEKSAEPSAEKPAETPPAKPSHSPEADDGKDYAAIGFELLESEGLGLIKLRLSESELIHLLGEPETKSEAEIWGGDGLAHANWSYPSKGLDLGMAQQPDDTEAYVYSISATAPCTLATEGGISIGSSKAAVLAAYKNEIDPAANDDTDSWITVGSVYGGLGIAIENGAVTYIYIGASAE